jgi:hypothetical protein
MLLRSLGLGRKFLNACEKNIDLAVSALDQARTAERESKLVLTTVGNNRIAGIAPPAKKDEVLINLQEAWNVIREIPGVTGAAEVPEIGRGRYDIRVLSDRFMNPIRTVGDLTQVGVRLSVGSRISVNPFAYRLVCANGMQRIEEGDVFFADGGDPLASLRSGFSQAMELATEMTTSFVRTDETRIDDPASFVMRALRIAGANNNLRAKVVDRLREAPNSTLYEVLNIVTAIGREIGGDNPGKRNRIEAVAGRVVAMQAGHSRCSKCDSTVNSV